MALNALHNVLTIRHYAPTGEYCVDVPKHRKRLQACKAYTPMPMHYVSITVAL